MKRFAALPLTRKLGSTGVTARRKRAWLPSLLIGMVFLYVGAIILLPVCALIAGAFQQGVGPVLAALSDPRALEVLARTVGIGLAVVAVHALFGTMAAWVFVRQRFPGRQFLSSLVDLPFAISPVVAGYMLLLLFGRNGLLAPLLTAVNIKVAFAIPGMILATMFVTLPLMIRELVPLLENAGQQQEQAAATLGANGWQIFWRVTFPALRWGFLYGLILTFARALGEFGAVLVIGGGIQGLTETTTIYIYHALDSRQYVAAYSSALVLGLFSLALVTIADLLRKRWIDPLPHSRDLFHRLL